MQNTLSYNPEWIELINTLPESNDRNALIAAITMYQINGQTIELSPTLHLVFLFIKKEIDAAMQQIRIAEARKEARRLKRAAKSGSIDHKNTSASPSETEQIVQALGPTTSDKPEPAPQPKEIDINRPSERSQNSSPKPDSKNKNFNSLIRAKNRHDRSRDLKRQEASKKCTGRNLRS